ncbi:MAG: ATP-binding protein [Gammaproteobacteria bacterium]|nr:ATP-binding protein [Gammaproteobacteria bacterium]MDE0412028.1 ATP-binding protein [Gammaproteobacteria bacterium]
MQGFRKVIVPNRLEEIRTIEIVLAEFADEQELPPEALFQIQLSLEEIFTNVVSYAHDDNQEHDVEIVLSKDGKAVTVEIIDDGLPFDPLKDAPELDVDSSLEDRGIGGAGIRLVRQMMSELNYKRDNARNHLVMVKKLS